MISTVCRLLPSCPSHWRRSSRPFAIAYRAALRPGSLAQFFALRSPDGDVGDVVGLVDPFAALAIFQATVHRHAELADRGSARGAPQLRVTGQVARHDHYVHVRSRHCAHSSGSLLRSSLRAQSARLAPSRGRFPKSGAGFGATRRRRRRQRRLGSRLRSSRPPVATVPPFARPGAATRGGTITGASGSTLKIRKRRTPSAIFRLWSRRVEQLTGGLEAEAGGSRPRCDASISMNSTDPSAGGGGGAGGGAGIGGGDGRGRRLHHRRDDDRVLADGPRPPLGRRSAARRATAVAAIRRLLAGSARAADTRATPVGGTAGSGGPDPRQADVGGQRLGRRGRSSGGSACTASSTARPTPTHLASVDHRTRTAPI